MQDVIIESCKKGIIIVGGVSTVTVNHYNHEFAPNTGEYTYRPGGQ
jgi:hypothetical protein